MKILGDFNVLWSYIKTRKKVFYQNLVLAIFVSLLSALSPYFYGKIVDSVKVQPSAINIIFLLLGAWFLTTLISSILSYVVNKKTTFLAADLYMDLINKSAYHLIRLPVSFHKEKKTGEILSSVERAAQYLMNIVDEILFWSLPQILTSLIGITFLFFIEWKLALGALFFLLGFVVITILKTNPIIKKQKELNKSFEKSYGDLYDSVLNVQAVKANTAEEFQEKKIAKSYNETNILLKKFSGLWQSLSFWQDIFSSFGFIILFSFAIFLLKSENISVGELIMFFGYFVLVRSPLQILGWHWRMYRTGISVIKRTENILDAKQEDYKKQGIILEDLKGKIEFKDVSFKYKGKKPVLEDISFEVLPGETIALVGKSGEGKTTLVDLLSLYFKPTKGKIFIDDVDIKKLNLKFLRENIASIPQEIILFNDTIQNNIRFGNPNATDSQVIESAKIANAHDFIMSFPKKYKQIVGERGIKLSAGQKQRIAIARALIRDPKILVLDEATSSLDSKTEKLVQDAMQKLFKSRTVVIIAHRLSTIKSANKILVIKNKKIVEEGTHSELVEKKGHYFEFYSIQSSHK